MAIGTALALGQAGFGFLQSQARGREAQRSAIAAHSQRAFSNRFSNLMIDRQNQLTEQRFGKQIEMTKKQFSFNQQAAQRAQSAEQIRMMEYNQQRGFSQLADRGALLQAMGANAEQGGMGNRSFELAALKGTQGRAGRQRAIDRESAISAYRGSKLRMEQIARDRLSADNQAFSNIAVPPMLQTRNAAIGPARLPRMNTGLMIAQAGMNFLGSAYNNTAPGAQFLGIGGNFFKKAKS